MDTTLAKNLAMTLMAKHNLYAMGYSFKFNNRRRSAGICSYRRKTIELSLALTELSDVLDVTDTILHEIAHALAGSNAGHGLEWQRIARSIGCNGDRCYNEKNKKSTSDAYKTVARYKGVCPNGHEAFRNRMPKRKTSCAECCPKYNPDFLFTFSENV